MLTGSGGFIGKNLKKYLSNNYKILSPRSFELDLKDKSATDEYFKEHDIDFVIHCGSTGGARGFQDKDTTIEDNLAMVENLLEAKSSQVRVILFGSGAMYGKTRNLHKVQEDEIGEFIPEDLYGKSKMLIAQKIRSRNDVLCLNIFACYGYGEKESRFPSYAILQNLKKEPITINQNVVFDYLFVEDMQKIVEYFIENRPEQNIINITPTCSSTLLEIAEAVNEISGFRSEIVIKNRVLGNEYTGDNRRLLESFASLEFTPLKAGLEKLFQYIKKSP